MNIKYLEPLYNVHRIALNDETYLRMADLGREFDARYRMSGIGSSLCKLFRQAKAGTFFYMEMNPAQQRGYYMRDSLLDDLVHFASSHHETVRAELLAKNQVTKMTKPAKRQTKRCLLTDSFVYSVTMIGSQELGHFTDNNEAWVKIADVARILRPNTQLYSVMPSVARHRGLTIRAVRHPSRGTRASYFVPMSAFEELCDILNVGPRTINARKIKSVIEGQTADEKPIEIERPLQSTSEIDELRALNAKLLDTVNSMMTLMAKQVEGPVKVDA